MAERGEVKGRAGMRNALIRRLRRCVEALAGDRRGNIAIITAVALPVLIGAAGLGAETSAWYFKTRSMQNAADAAAVAAATNGSSSYAAEALAVAAQYGFQNGVNNVTVTASNTATCPGTTSATCYSVAITSLMPLMLTQMVGYQGNATVAGKPYQSLTAAAIAKTVARQYCLGALATSGASEGIRTNGMPNANMQGCNVISNTEAICNSSNGLGADNGDAHYASKGCGATNNSYVPELKDQWAKLASNIVESDEDCGGSYPAETKQGNTYTAAPQNQLGSASFASHYCGDVQLTSNIVVNSPNDTLVIYNGNLDLNGHTLSTASGASLTVIFTGSNSTSYSHTMVDNSGGGTLDVAAPDTGSWQGMALYQDPSLTTNVDMTFAGNSPHLSISGMAYMPHASVTLSGAIDHGNNSGDQCFSMVVDNITINGTGAIENNPNCNSSNGPQGALRGQLVY